jgi:hypothetical protein
MSRAFVKEDNQTPELEKVGEYRAYWGLSRSDIESEIKFSSNNLLEVIKWVREKTNGFYLLIDANGTVMGEVG